jgi:hypothetical protein
MPPLAPSSLTVKSASPNQINLTWIDNAIGEGGFQIKRCQGANCKTFTSVAQLGQNVVAFSNTGLTTGVSYTYYVYAYNECGNSLSSNYVTVVTPLPPPAAPTNLAATAISTSQINLSWTDASSNEGGFKIERCAGSTCTNFAQVAQAGAGVTSFANSGLSKAVTYRYRICAFNSGGNSAYSSIVTKATASK